MDNLRGINTDVSPRNQLPGTYRFALNAANNSKEGDLKTISNEQGNRTDVDIPEGFLIIGDCFLRPNHHIIVSVDDSGYSRIDQRINGILQNLFYIKDIGWNKRYQLKIRTKIVNGCEDIIIVTDGNSTIRYINITEREQYLLDGETITSANADGEGWDLGLLSLNLQYTSPLLSSVNVFDTGGSLELGTYIIVPQYLTAGFDATSWLTHTGVIPIVNESMSGDWTQLDGGFEITTTKSIRVEFTNLDTSFNYLRLALISNIDGVVSASIIATLPFTSDSLSYVITGNETKTSITIEELISENNVYDSAEDITLYDNRLWLLNVKERQIDHSIFQAAAFNIKGFWFSKKVKTEISNGEDTKSVTYYLDNRSYMRDEVYAFGIRYIFKGGYTTPVYPLISRAKDTGSYTTLSPTVELNTWHNRLAPTSGWDSTTYTVGTDIPLADVEHLGFVTGVEDIGDGPGLVQRWRVFNTATVEIIDTDLIGYEGQQGEFAYIESTLNYPNNAVYGTYAGQPIRDFKFPDAILSGHVRGFAGGQAVSVFENDYIASNYSIYPIGVKFTNINIPTEYADEIEGYEIVRVERTDFNSTVLDKGVIARVIIAENDDDDTYLHQAMPGNYGDEITDGYYHRYINENYQVLHNPVSKFSGYTNGSFLKIEGEQYGLGAKYPGSTGSRIMCVKDSVTENFTETLYHRLINQRIFAPADSPILGGLTEDVNNTEQQEAVYLELNNVLNYSRVESAFEWTENIYFLYTALKENLTAQYGQAEGRIYISTSGQINTATEIEVFGGDVFISPLIFRRHARWDENGRVLNHYEEGDISTTVYSQLFKVYVESKINCNFRNEGPEENDVYYPKSFYNDILNFIVLEENSATAGEDEDLIPNYYAYNTCFSQENNIKPFFGIPFSFNYESDCLGEYPTRIACSEQDTVESSADFNKIFLPNNYRDLPKNKGEGLSLFVRGDRLFAHMERTIFQIPVKAQQLRVGDINAYFGTGEVLSIPPSEVVTIEKGYAGLSSKFSSVETPYGHVFVDHENKKVFLFTETLEPISNLGIYSWSNENMTFKFIEDFRSLMQDVNPTTQYERFRNNASPFGIGFHSTYDPKLDRVIITKRDYRIKFDVGIGNGLFMGTYNSLIFYPEGAIIWDATNQVFQVIQGQTPGSQVRYDLNYYDTDYFEDCSFTISFSFLSKSWVSFHSYIPLYYFFDTEQFFSYFWKQTISHTHAGSPIYIQTDSSQSLYIHDKDADFQKYYGIVKDHILDIIITAQSPSNFTNVFVDTKLSDLSATYKERLDIDYMPFTQIIAYNTSQCSGEHDIITINGYNEIEDWSSSNSFTRRIGNLWRISNIRDLVTNTSIPMFTSAYSDIKTSYYIDKILNTAAIDYNLSQYKMKKMYDFWIGIRLKSNLNTQKDIADISKLKITTNVIDTLNYYKVR